MAGSNQIKAAGQPLRAVIDAEMAAVGAAFRKDLQRLITSVGDVAEVELRIDALLARLDADVQAIFDRYGPNIPSPPPRDKPMFEEPRRRPPGRSLRRPPPRPSAGGVTVEPNKPNNLSGGAAAPLETD